MRPHPQSITTVLNPFQVGNPVAVVTLLEAREETMVILILAVMVTPAVMAVMVTLALALALLAQRHTIQIHITVVFPCIQ